LRKVDLLILATSQEYVIKIESYNHSDNKYSTELNEEGAKVEEAGSRLTDANRQIFISSEARSHVLSQL